MRGKCVPYFGSEQSISVRKWGRRKKKRDVADPFRCSLFAVCFALPSALGAENLSIFAVRVCIALYCTDVSN